MAAQPPTHTAYHVRQYKAGKDEKSFWTKIGSVWAHGDGEGFNIRLNGLVPLNGEIVVRSVKDRKPAADQADDSAAVEGDSSIPR
jgi:hypothetical protein